MEPLKEGHYFKKYCQTAEQELCILTFLDHEPEKDLAARELD